MKNLLIFLVLVITLVTAGCIVINQNPAASPTPQIVYVTVTPTHLITTQTQAQQNPQRENYRFFNEPWTQITPDAGWSARYGHTSVVMPDGSIVLMGGYDNINFKNDVWRSTDNGKTWNQMTPSAGWSARYGHTSVMMPDGSIVLMGGTSNNNINGIKNDVWRSTDNGKTWSQMTPDAGWSPRYDYSSVAIPDGSIVLMGGLSGSNSVSSKNDVWRSTDNGKTWSQMTPDAGWSPRYSHSSVAMPDGSIVLTGGIENVGKGPFKNDVWRSTDYGKTWNQMTPYAGWSVRCGHTSVAMPDGSIVLMGGNGDGRISSLKNDVWQSNDNGASWIQVNTGAGWTARSSHTSVAMPDGSIVLMGGGDNTASFNRNDVWRIMPTGS